jgi:hypothetical protein
MLGLNFTVESAAAVPFAAVPTIAFRLNVKRSTAGPDIKNIALRAQIMIEASRRHYLPDERQALRDLFGEPDRWSRTLRSLLWTQAFVTVPPFDGTTTQVDLLVPCTFDFNIAATKFFHAVENGNLPLCFQFSGTIFYATPTGAVQIEQISWNQEANFQLPVTIWQEMIDHYYPNSAWLRLRRDTFDRLLEFKTLNGIASWEEAVDRLLVSAKEPVS